MLTVELFTCHQFDGQDKASELFGFLNDVGDIFVPVRYGTFEPVRKIYNVDDLSEPIKLLSGYPQYRSGDIFLKGAKYKFLAWIRWSEASINSWYIFLDNTFFNKPARVEKFIKFIAELCNRFQIIFGGAVPEEDWDAKHILVLERPNGGRSDKKVGQYLENCLPGVYWVTIFGESVVEYFGHEKIKNLPAYKILDLGNGGILMMLRENPFHPEQAERLRHDTEIMDILDKKYFFDINNPDKICRPIPGVTQDLKPEIKRVTDRSEQQQVEEIEEDFENQIVLSPDGVPYTHPRSLAEGIIVIFHEDIKNLSSFSRSALNSLDAYWEKHPLTLDYSYEFLLKEFVPLIGAYLGEVLVQQLGANWKVQKPLMKSSVMMSGMEFFPFREAYRIVFEKLKLIAIYDSIISSLEH